VKKTAMESRVLALGSKERAHLALRLIESLDELTESEWLDLWAEEADRRDAEMDQGTDTGMPAALVFEDVEAHLD
jgi:hypothetical protein